MFPSFREDYKQLFIESIQFTSYIRVINIEKGSQIKLRKCMKYPGENHAKEVVHIFEFNFQAFFMSIK